MSRSLLYSTRSLRRIAGRRDLSELAYRGDRCLVSRPMKALLIAALLVVITAPAAAAAASVAADPFLLAFTQVEEEESEAPPTTAVSEGGVAPAELAPPVADELAEDQWTAKFLAPTVALLGLLGVVVSIALYGLRVRSKYRIVD